MPKTTIFACAAIFANQEIERLAYWGIDSGAVLFMGNDPHHLGAPRHLPAEIAEALNKEVNAALTDPALQARLTDPGIAPMPMTWGDCSPSRLGCQSLAPDRKQDSL